MAKMSSNKERVLGTEVMNILKSYAYKFRKSDKRDMDCWTSLMASLYSYFESNPNKEVIEILSKGSNAVIVDIEEYFDAEGIETLRNNYRDVVAYCSDAFTKDVVDCETGYHTQPFELSELCCKLLNVKEDSSVYLPFAGYVSEYPYLPACSITAEEIEMETWAICTILNEVLGRKIHLYRENSTKNAAKTEDQYDTIICSGIYANDTVKTMQEICENKLKEGGRLCCVLPSNVLYKEDAKDFRKYLVENGYLRKVISLPAVFKPVMGVKWSVLIIEKSCQETFQVVEGSDYTLDDWRDTIDLERLFDQINQVGDDSKTLSIKDLSNDYELSPLKLLFSLPPIQEGEKLYTISELAQMDGKRILQEGGRTRGNGGIIRGDRGRIRGEDSKKKPHFMVSNFSTDYTYCELIKEPVDQSMSGATYKVPKHVLAVQVRNGKAKVGKLSDVDSHVVQTRGETFFMNVKSDLVMEDYFLKMMLSDYVAKQVKVLVKGTAVERITPKDFLSIQVPIPTLDRQKEILLSDFHESVNAKERKITEDFDRYKEDIRRRKHSLGNLMLGLNSSWKTLLKLKDLQEGVIDESMEIKGKNIGALLNNIDKHIADIGYAIRMFNVEVTENEGEELDIVAFAHKYISEHQGTPYSIQLQNTELESEARSRISGKDLGEIFDNILANAISHGFEGRDVEHNSVVFKITKEDDIIMVEVSNNGDPLEHPIKPDEVFQYGVRGSKRGSHSGLGGNIIKQIMEKHGGSVELISTPQNEYTVTYRLRFNTINK